MIEQLKQAGLTGNEIKVYLALIELGPSLAGQISRKSGLHRRNVYDTTEMLIKKGLIGYIIQNNRRLFQASDPKRIIEIIQEKQTNLLPVIETLTKKYNSKKETETTLFFKGKNGLKSVFEDQLNAKEILILGAHEDASEVLKFYFHWYNQKRIKKKIETKVIAHNKTLARIKKAKIKYLPKKYASPVAINIYGDKTAIILWSDNPMAIVIKNKKITDGYKKYFKLMWNIAKE